MSIQEYKYKGETAYRGKVICPVCEEFYEIDTTSKEIANNPPACFMCKLANKDVK